MTDRKRGDLFSLYPFRYRDPLHARYVAELDVIAAHYEQWEITGPAELRTGGGGSFNPFRGPTMHVTHLPTNETPPSKNHR